MIETNTIYIYIHVYVYNKKLKYFAIMKFLKCTVIVFLSIVVVVCHAITPAMQQFATATTGTRLIRESKPQWHAQFIPKNATAHMDTELQIEVNITS